MAWASCETASQHSIVKPGKQVDVNTELVKYAFDRVDTTTLVFVDGEQLHIKGTLEDYRKARTAAELEDAQSWGR
jgi:hypothetical protein